MHVSRLQDVLCSLTICFETKMALLALSHIMVVLTVELSILTESLLKLQKHMKGLEQFYTQKSPYSIVNIKEPSCIILKVKYLIELEKNRVQ